MAMTPSVFIEKLKGSPYHVPQSLGVAGYSTRSNGQNSPISGCCLDYFHMGTAAVDLLQTMIHSGQRGVPADYDCYDVLIRVSWHEGSTTRHFEALPLMQEIVDTPQGTVARQAGLSA